MTARLAVDHLELRPDGRVRTVWTSTAWLALPTTCPRNWPRPAAQVLHAPDRQLTVTWDGPTDA